jgi:hypothetical protein
VESGKRCSVRDINGNELREGAAASLLCEIVAIEPEGIRVRVMNSELELQIGTHQDEVLGGDVADSELTAFEVANNCRCIVGCTVNGDCPVHGDGGHLPSRQQINA